MWVDHTYAQDGGHGRPNGGAKEIMEIGDGWLIDTKAVKVPVLIITGDNDFYVTLTDVIKLRRNFQKDPNYFICTALVTQCILKKITIRLHGKQS